MIVLTIHEVGREPYRVEQSRLEAYVGIGRSATNHVVLADPSVANHHCMLRAVEEGCVLEVAPSAPPVRVDGRLVEGSVALSPGARVQIGQTLVEVQFVAADDGDPSRTLEIDPAVFRRRLARHRAEGRQTKTLTEPSVIVADADLGATVERTVAYGAAAETMQTRFEKTLAMAALRPRDASTRRPQPLLRIIGGAEEATHLLREGESIIGRAGTNGLRIEHRRISRHHAKVRVHDGQVFLEGGLSKGRTRVNNREVVGEVRLADGDLIRIGPAVLEFTYGQVDESSGIARLEGRFIVDGQVFEQPTLLIGRAACCDITVDHTSVEEEHLRIERAADGSFRILEKGYFGVLLNGQRIIEDRLNDGDRIGFGAHGIRVAIAGDTCHLDLLEARTLTRESFVAGADPSGEPAAAPTAAMVARRPAIWSPPGDVRCTVWGRLLVLLGVAAGLTGLTLLTGTGGADELLGQPVSPAHGSPAFAEASDGAGCHGCHTEGVAVTAARCEACHPGRPTRSAHAALARPGETLERGCIDCHAEHPPSAEVAVPAPIDGCTNAACHATRHTALAALEPEALPTGARQAEQARRRAPALSDIGAERFLEMRRESGLADLHASHGGLEGRCLGCHVGLGGGENTATATSCFRCHEGREALAGEDCSACHLEHDTVRVPAPGSTTPGPAIAGTGWGAAFAILAVAPLLLLVGVRWVVVDARAKPEAPPEPPDPKLEIHISSALCVGSNACVEACPYGVLQLASDGDRRIAKVGNFQSCNECNVCVEVCSPEALIRVKPGEPIPGVIRPDIDAHFMTRVPGLYLIGQASGVSFVRNAINLGARTVHHIRSKGIVPVHRARAGFEADVAVIGAGPAGLSAAMTAHELGMTAVVFEKGSAFAPTIRSFHVGKPVQNQPSEVALIGSLWMEDCVRETLLERWETQLAAVPLDLRFGREVTTIEPIPAPVGGSPVTDGFRLGTRGGETLTAARVIVAVGGGEPRRMTKVPGHDLPKVATGCLDPSRHDGDRICVVGGGNSALEVAAACAEANGGSNEVRLVYRQQAFTKASARNRSRIEALIAAGRLTAHLSSNPIEFQADSVVLEGPEGRQTVPNTYVYTMLGRVTPRRWLESLGVEFVERDREWAPARSDDMTFLARGVV